MEVLKILIVEDNAAHLADALAEVKSRVESGENLDVAVARDLSGYYDLIDKNSYDGIVSDIFFPSDASEPSDNLASNLVWDILGKKYCEEHRRDYGSGDKRREKKIYELVQDGWMDGTELPPSGVIVADRANKAGIPVVLCTDTHHHGIKTQPVHEYALREGIKIIDAYVGASYEGNTSHKDWKGAFDLLRNKMAAKCVPNPKSVREAAGMKAVEAYAKSRCCVDLIEMSKDKDMPESVREAAGMKAIELCELFHDAYLDKVYAFTWLIDFSKDKDMPESVREAAGMKAIEVFVKYGEYDDLIKMSKDENRSESLRKVAAELLEPVALKRLEAYAKKKGFPASVQAILNKAAEELAAKRIPNPIAKDGMLSPGTVKPPAKQQEKAPTKPRNTLSG